MGDNISHWISDKRFLDEVELAHSSTLSKERWTTLRKLIEKMNHMHFECNVYFQNLVQEPELKVSEDFSGKQTLVPYTRF